MSISAPCLDLNLLLNQPGIVADSVDAAPPVVALTRALVAGDEIAYRRFHEAYCPRLHRYLLVVAAGDKELAREALQAACIRVVRHIKVFSDEQIFWNWLTVLARTALADHRRKRSRYRAFLDRFTWHTRADAAGRGEDGRADAQLLALLERSLRDLPHDERELIERKYFGRAAVREIADGLAISEKAVESRLGRVRRKLKDALLTKLKDESKD